MKKYKVLTDIFRDFKKSDIVTYFYVGPYATKYSNTPDLNEPLYLLPKALVENSPTLFAEITESELQSNFDFKPTKPLIKKELKPKTTMTKKYKVITDLFDGFEKGDILTSSFRAKTKTDIYIKESDNLGLIKLDADFVESHPEYFEEVKKPLLGGLEQDLLKVFKKHKYDN